MVAKLQDIAEQDPIKESTELYALPAIWRIASMIDQQVKEVDAFYRSSTHDSTTALQPDELGRAPDFLQYFFPTALEVIRQGKQLTQHLVQVLMEDFIAPHSSPLSLQACVNTILELYARQHQQHVSIKQSEDCKICISFLHLQYAMIQILRFLHAHHFGEQISLRITQQAEVYIKLSGRVLSASLIRELFTLFPFQTITKNPGLAISKLLIEAHRGRLLYKTSALPSNPYTEFSITLPFAESIPDIGA